MILSGNMIEIDIEDIDDIDDLMSEELNESAMIEAMNDIEEEYESETVSDYMNYGV